MRLDDYQRYEIKAIIKRAVEREQMAYFDPFGLGALNAYVLRIPKISRGLSRDQTLALVTLLRDVSDRQGGSIDAR